MAKTQHANSTARGPPLVKNVRDAVHERGVRNLSICQSVLDNSRHRLQNDSWVSRKFDILENTRWTDLEDQISSVIVKHEHWVRHCTGAPEQQRGQSHAAGAGQNVPLTAFGKALLAPLFGQCDFCIDESCTSLVNNKLACSIPELAARDASSLREVTVAAGMWRVATLFDERSS